MPDSPQKPPAGGDKLPAGMLPAPIERILAVTRTLRRIGDELLEEARHKRERGELSLAGYMKAAEQHQELINHANRAVYRATESLPPLDAQVIAVEAATKELETATKNLRRVTDILALSAKLVLAVTSVVAAVFRPDPMTIAASAEAIVNAARVIRDQVHR